MTHLLSGVLLTHACVIRQHGEWEYALWAIGHGHLANANQTVR